MLGTQSAPSSGKVECPPTATRYHGHGAGGSRESLVGYVENMQSSVLIGVTHLVLLWHPPPIPIATCFQQKCERTVVQSDSMMDK